MPRPKNKADLLKSSKENYEKLIELINSYSKKELEKQFTPDKLYQNIRDIVAHLHHWNELMLAWYKEGMKGNKPQMPAEGYTWKTLPEYNELTHAEYLDKPTSAAIKLFKKSFKKVYKLIEQHSDEELFTKKKYKWTGTTSLGAYIISATSSHYDWAIKRIKKSMKE